MMEAFEIGLSCACIAVVFSMVLRNEWPIIDRYIEALYWVENKLKFKYLANPLGDCEKCLAGQLGLWSSLFLFEFGYTIYHFLTYATASTSAVLFASYLSNQLIKWQSEN